MEFFSLKIKTNNGFSRLNASGLRIEDVWAALGSQKTLFFLDEDQDKCLINTQAELDGAISYLKCHAKSNTICLSIEVSSFVVPAPPAMPPKPNNNYNNHKSNIGSNNNNSNNQNDRRVKVKVRSFSCRTAEEVASRHNTLGKLLELGYTDMLLNHRALDFVFKVYGSYDLSACAKFVCDSQESNRRKEGMVRSVAARTAVNADVVQRHSALGKLVESGFSDMFLNQKALEHARKHVGSYDVVSAISFILDEQEREMEKAEK